MPNAGLCRIRMGPRNRPLIEVGLESKCGIVGPVEGFLAQTEENTFSPSAAVLHRSARASSSGLPAGVSQNNSSWKGAVQSDRVLPPPNPRSRLYCATTRSDPETRPSSACELLGGGPIAPKV